LVVEDAEGTDVEAIEVDKMSGFEGEGGSEKETVPSTTEVQTLA
jgi:hypothetical protein